MNLGIDLETEILAWLPPKSLMRFRCVHRSWNALFKSSTFLKKWRMNMSSKSHSLMIHYSTEPYISLLSCDNLIHIKSLFSNNALHRMRIEFYGSCNGVFCLKRLCWFHKSCLDELIMWNPTTREVHHVPPSLCLDSDSCMYGFGADDPNNIDFKVVKLNFNCYGEENELCISSVEVYNLSTNSWTPTEHPPLFAMITRQRLPRYNTLVNSVYHWITNNSYSNHNDDHVANILCFDFRNNQFHQLTGPTISYEDHNFLYHDFLWDDVAEIKGSLAYVVQHYFSAPVVLKIWVMDQSGWEKKYNIGPTESMFFMFGLWKNDDQVLGGKVGEPLTSYNHEGNSLCQFQIDVDYTKYFFIHEYVPSIAPLSN